MWKNLSDNINATPHSLKVGVETGSEPFRVFVFASWQVPLASDHANGQWSLARVFVAFLAWRSLTLL